MQQAQDLTSLSKVMERKEFLNPLFKFSIVSVLIRYNVENLFEKCVIALNLYWTIHTLLTKKENWTKGLCTNWYLDFILAVNSLSDWL